MNMTQDLLSLLFIGFYTFVVFYYLAEKKVNYIKRYLLVSILHLLATVLVLRIFQRLLSQYLPYLNLLLFAFIAIFILVIMIYRIFRRFINIKIVTKHQNSGTYTASLNQYYAVSKSFNILFQQTLILISVLLLKNIGLDVLKTSIVFSLAFGVAHIILVDWRKPYTFLVVMASFFVGAIFPVIILLFPLGIVYTYILHWLFLIMLGIAPHFIENCKI